MLLSDFIELAVVINDDLTHRGITDRTEAQDLVQDVLTGKITYPGQPDFDLSAKDLIEARDAITILATRKARP